MSKKHFTLKRLYAVLQRILIHHKYMRSIILVLALGIILPSCLNNHNPAINSNKTSESFDAFYEWFTLDSNFQMSRVCFPLKGHYMDNEIAGTVEEDTFTWTRQNWKIIHQLDKSLLNQYTISRSISDSLAIIKTEGLQDDMIFEETYKKLNGKWFLITLTDISM